MKEVLYRFIQEHGVSWRRKLVLMHDAPEHIQLLRHTPWETLEEWVKERLN